MVASFTRAAVAELNQRDLPIPEQNLGTLHSLAYRTLDYPEIVETGKHFKDFNETVPTSEKEKAPDGRSELEKNAETYAKGKMESKAKEFADCHTLSDGTSRAMYLHSVGKAKF